MGITQNKGRRVPLSPAFGLPHLVQSRIMQVPPNNLVGIAQAQAFNGLAANSLATAFPTLFNPLLLNAAAGGAGVFTIGQPAGSTANRGVYLAVPAVLSIQSSAAAAATFSMRVRGVDHLGRQITIIDSGVMSGFGFFEGSTCWSYIDTIEILTYTGGGSAPGDTLSAGWTCSHSALSQTRLPLPFDAARSSEVVGAVLIDPGASGVFAGWTIGQMILPPAAQTLVGPVNFPGNGTMRFQPGNMTTPGTTLLKYAIVTSVGAINAH